MTIGERIKKVRLQQGLTTKELAKQIGKSKNAITEIETGRATSQWEKLREICDILDVSADYILGRTDRDRKKENS